MSRRVCLIVNPASGGGWSRRRLRRLETAAARHLPEHVIRTTEGPGHASALAREAGRHGFDVVAAVGGDGTAHEVVNGFFEAAEACMPHVGFGLVHHGTGGDLRRTLEVPHALDDAVRRLGSSPLVPMDVLDVAVTPLEGGEPVRRVCVNVAGFGLNGEVVRFASTGVKRVLGPLTFSWATARALMAMKPAQVTLRTEDASGTRDTWSGPLVSVFVANGGWCGGGMWVGRGGSPTDGLTDVTVIPDMPFSRLVWGTPRLFDGRVTRVKGVSRTRMRSLLALTEEARPVRVDLDGELSGCLPLEIRVMPKALLVASSAAHLHSHARPTDLERV